MWSFRKKETKPVPKEVKEYYAGQKRDRLWGVWLLSLATFILTLLIVLGLFWGVRWVYHKITDKDQKPETISVEEKNQAEKNSSESGSSEGSSNSSNGSGSNGGNTSSGTPKPSTPQTSNPPATGAPSPALVNTGPTSDE